MKLSNKLIIISACLCAFAFSLLLSAWVRHSGETQKEESLYTPLKTKSEETTKVENNISPSIGKTEEKTKYLLRLDDGRVCAYILSPDGTRFLWNSMQLPPALTKEEIDELENGMTLKSFEEMCLYFEAYAS